MSASTTANTPATKAASDASRPAGFSWIKSDFLSSIVVFLVALPLCMGIAMASGAPPAAGLITGIVGGLIVGSISGAPLQVSGPAAGLAVIVFEIIRRAEEKSPGSGLRTLGIVLLLAGAIQLAAGILKLGQWFRAVSPAVIHGMLAGIGVLIFVGQFHVMVDRKVPGTGLQNIKELPKAVMLAVSSPDGTSHRAAAVIGVLTIAVILAWKSLAPKKFQLLPATLLAVVIATAATALVGLKINLVSVPQSILSAVTLPNAQSLGWLLDGQIIVAALGMAFVASAETLLCATAVDKMHNGPRTQYDRELAAQGIGNMICGGLGALPMTGVIVRSAANVEAGAKTRASAILHGAWLLLFVATLPWILRLIPTASLAALLVFTGFKLVNLKAIKDLKKFGKGEVAIYFATLGMIVATDLLTGVLIGIGLSAVKLLHKFSHLHIDLKEEPLGNRTVMYLRGAATFVGLPKLAAALERIKPSTELHVHFEKLLHIDHACLDLLVDWEKQHRSTGGRLVIDWDELTARFQPPTKLLAGPDEGESPAGGNGRRATPAFRLERNVSVAN